MMLDSADSQIYGHHDNDPDLSGHSVPALMTYSSQPIIALEQVILNLQLVSFALSTLFNRCIVGYTRLEIF